MIRFRYQRYHADLRRWFGVSAPHVQFVFWGCFGSTCESQFAALRRGETVEIHGFVYRALCTDFTDQLALIGEHYNRSQRQSVLPLPDLGRLPLVGVKKKQVQ